MINLMPDDAKKELRAARTNVVLIRYIGIITLAVLFLLTILVGGYMVLGRTQESAKQLIAANDLKADVYSTTEAQVATLSAGLSEARGILDQEILYSKVLMGIGQLMPKGTVIDKIELDSSSFGTSPVTLQVYAKTTGDTVSLQSNFKNSPLFSNVTFQTVSDNSGALDGYPVSATLVLTFNRGAAR